jgi:hypothetical protein
MNQKKCGKETLTSPTVRTGFPPSLQLASSKWALWPSAQVNEIDQIKVKLKRRCTKVGIVAPQYGGTGIKTQLVHGMP